MFYPIYNKIKFYLFLCFKNIFFKINIFLFQIKFF